MPEIAKPAGVSGGHREFLTTNWKRHEKSTLRAFLSLTLPSGLVLNNCSFHTKDRARWIGVPAQKYEKDDGTIAYTPLVEFDSKEARQRFQAAALAAVDRYMGAAGC